MISKKRLIISDQPFLFFVAGICFFNTASFARPNGVAGRTSHSSALYHWASIFYQRLLIFYSTPSGLIIIFICTTGFTRGYLYYALSGLALNNNIPCIANNYSRFTIHDSRFTIHDSRFTILSLTRIIILCRF